MKITLGKKKEEKGVTYPRLMVRKTLGDGDDKDIGLVILATDENAGTVLFSPETAVLWPVGMYYSSWNNKAFEPFNGPITLEND
jgi:hypothetical protein